MYKPLIGITKSDNENFTAYLAIKAAIRMAGGRSVKLVPADNRYQSAGIDGLVLGGGKDVFPGLYDQIPKLDYQYDRERDEMEIYWAEQARDEHIPALGICRGAQLMNVVCGGSLHLSVFQAYKDAYYPDGLLHHIFYRKKIFLKDGSLLRRVTGCPELYVNSIHKQAIASLGSGICVNAREKNGVVQAIHHKDHPFYLGVQFHPEFLVYRRVFRKVFDALIVAARERHGRF